MSFPLALSLVRKENQLQLTITCHVKIFILKKRVFVLCSSYKPPPQNFDHQKFRKKGGVGLFAGIYVALP